MENYVLISLFWIVVLAIIGQLMIGCLKIYQEFVFIKKQNLENQWGMSTLEILAGAMIKAKFEGVKMVGSSTRW